MLYYVNTQQRTVHLKDCMYYTMPGTAHANWWGPYFHIGEAVDAAHKTGREVWLCTHCLGVLRRPD